MRTKASMKRSWLRIHCNADWSRQDRRPSPTLWNADLAPLPTGEHDVVHAEVADHYTWLSNIRDLGFAILRGVPTDEDEILRAAQLIGYVRETNYGRTFDVVAVKRSDQSRLHARRAAAAYRQPLPRSGAGPTASALPAIKCDRRAHAPHRRFCGGGRTTANRRRCLRYPDVYAPSLPLSGWRGRSAGRRSPHRMQS